MQHFYSTVQYILNGGKYEVYSDQQSLRQEAAVACDSRLRYISLFQVVLLRCRRVTLRNLLRCCDIVMGFLEFSSTSSPGDSCRKVMSSCSRHSWSCFSPKPGEQPNLCFCLRCYGVLKYCLTLLGHQNPQASKEALSFSYDIQLSQCCVLFLEASLHWNVATFKSKNPAFLVLLWLTVHSKASYWSPFVLLGISWKCLGRDKANE